MISATFYTFEKKENSTAIPVTGTQLNIEIKDASSIFFPYILLNRGAASAPSFNYCYIPAFSRYYWITDWTWNCGIWEASLKCDVLASYKSQIGSASLYALRAANSYDGSVPDLLYPAKAGCTYSDSALSSYRPWANALAGCYVLGIVSQDADFGSIDYIVLTRANLKTFISELLTNGVSLANGFSTADASYALQASLIDPLQYIKSCTYIPFTITEITSCLTSSSKINIWDWEFNIACYKVNYSSPFFTVTNSLDVPKHPQAATRGQFVNQAPYSNYTLFVPPFGSFNMDSTMLVGETSITLNTQIDLPTGLGVLTVSRTGQVIQRLESQIGVPVQLSQVLHDYVGAAIGAVGAVGGAIGSAMSGNIAGAITTGITGLIGSAIDAKYPSVQSLGSGGSYAQLMGIWRLAAQFFTIVDDDITHNGRPLCQMVTPSSVNGYMLIQDGDIAIPGTQEEAQEIKRYLESGFYYE